MVSTFVWITLALFLPLSALRSCLFEHSRRHRELLNRQHLCAHLRTELDLNHLIDVLLSFAKEFFIFVLVLIYFVLYGVHLLDLFENAFLFLLSYSLLYDFVDFNYRFFLGEILELH
jgi:hypothetical protein